jgi:hypothetical protein
VHGRWTSRAVGHRARISWIDALVGVLEKPLSTTRYAVLVAT